MKGLESLAPTSGTRTGRFRSVKSRVNSLKQHKLRTWELDFVDSLAQADDLVLPEAAEDVLKQLEVRYGNNHTRQTTITNA